MPEKLLTLREVSILLGISDGEVKKLVKKGALPAYRVGGRFLRFRREQIEAVRNEIPARLAGRTPEAAPERFRKKTEEALYSQSQGDRIADFFYFNDFYIVSGLIIFLILWITFFI